MVRVRRTYGHGLAERSGYADCEEVPRAVIQRQHGQRAVRRQPSSFFLSECLADVVGVCLGLLHVESAKRLYKRADL